MMDKIKRIKMVLFALLFVSTAFCQVFADSSVGYAYRNLKETQSEGIIPLVAVNSVKSFTLYKRVSGVLITGKRPVIEKLGKPALENALNEKILATYNEIIENLSEGTKSVVFDFHTYLYGDVVSVIMSTLETSASSNEKRRSINFNVKTQEIVGINDVLGLNGTKVLTKYVTGQIKKKPDLYTTDFTEVTNDSAFYVASGNFVVCFDKYKIAPGARGIVEFKLPLNNFKSVEVKQDDYFLTTLYNIKMIRLSQISEALSFRLKWVEKQNLVTVWKNNALVSTFTIDQNKYTKGKNVVKPLECAPMLSGDRTYVPISFFEEILDISYTVDNNSDILFSSYIE